MSNAKTLTLAIDKQSGERRTLAQLNAKEALLQGKITMLQYFEMVRELPVEQWVSEPRKKAS